MKTIQLSLKIKMTAVVLTVALVIACAATLVSYNVYAGTMDAHYETITMNLARTAPGPRRFCARLRPISTRLWAKRRSSTT